MHDIKRIRSNPEELDSSLIRRGLPPCSHIVIELDKKLRQVQTNIQEIYRKQKEISKKTHYLRILTEERKLIDKEIFLKQKLDSLLNSPGVQETIKEIRKK